MCYNVIVDINTTSSFYGFDTLKVAGILEEYGSQYKFYGDNRRISKTVNYVATADEYWFLFFEPNEENFEIQIKERMIDLQIVTSLIYYRNEIEKHRVSFVGILIGNHSKIYNHIHELLPLPYRLTIDWLHPQEQENLYDTLKCNIENKKNNNIMMKNNKNNPWLSGSYYLIVFLIVMAVLAAISKIVTWYILPIVFIAGLLAIPIIGVFQALNDNTLSEKGFLTIILESYNKLPLLKRLSKSNSTNDKKD